MGGGEPGEEGRRPPERTKGRRQELALNLAVFPRMWAAISSEASGQAGVDAVQGGLTDLLVVASLFWRGLCDRISMLSKGPPFVVAGAVGIRNSRRVIKSGACRELWEVRMPGPLPLTSGPSVERCGSLEIFF